MNTRISSEGKLLSAFLAFVIFSNVVYISSAFAAETDKAEFYVGKQATYQFTQKVENLDHTDEGTITYIIDLYDPTTGEYTITIQVNLLLSDGTPYVKDQTITKNYKNPFEIVTDTLFIDSLVPGDSSLIKSDASTSVVMIKDEKYDTRVEKQSIVKSHLLASSEEPTNKFEAKLENKINEIVTYLKESRIPYSVEWKLEKAELVGVSDEDLRNEILEDYGQLVDLYKNMKFSISLVLTETNIDLKQAEQFFTGYYATSDKGGCLIATATYGSELAPQVQFLREIRDNTVLSTASGTSFMTAFNTFYYSFSPVVADLERENPVFKEIVKATITPLLTSLTLFQYVDIDSEQEMLGYGISIILLNIGMYFVAPALIVFKLKNRKKEKLY